jgi:hypothetical protein
VCYVCYGYQGSGRLQFEDEELDLFDDEEGLLVVGVEVFLLVGGDYGDCQPLEDGEELVVEDGVVAESQLVEALIDEEVDVALGDRRQLQHALHLLLPQAVLARAPLHAPQRLLQKDAL